MASPNSKNNQEDIASDGSSALSTGSSVTDDSASGSSSVARTSSPSTTHRSRLDSFHSTSSSLRNPRSPSLRSRRFSSGSRSNSASHSGSDVSRRSIPRRRSFSKKIKKSPKKAVRPIGEISMLKNPMKTEARSFLHRYATAEDFDAFSVDGIPFVAFSLLTADREFPEMLQTPPPTPMKKHTPGVNSPRKRSHSLNSRSSIGSKHVSFADEGSSPEKKSKKSLSDDGSRGLEMNVDTNDQ